MSIVSWRVHWKLRQCSVCRLIGNEEWRDTRITCTTTSCKVLGRAKDWGWRETCHEIGHGCACRTFSSHVRNRMLQEGCTRHHLSVWHSYKQLHRMASTITSSLHAPVLKLQLEGYHLCCKMLTDSHLNEFCRELQITSRHEENCRMKL